MPSNKELVKNFFDKMSYELQSNALFFQNIEKFNPLVKNLVDFMQYVDINETWAIQNNSLASIARDTHFISRLKKQIRNMLLTSIKNTLVCNIIFMFHHHLPINYSFHAAYKLLINTLLDPQAAQEGVNVNLLLSIYLTHAAIYNHEQAIKILIENYKACPIQKWINIPNDYQKFNLHIMPIIHITNPTHVNLSYRCFISSKHQREQIFLYMLHNINIDEPIGENNIQNIFRCAFKHLFTRVIDYLLNNPSLCKNIDITENDIIMFAFGSIMIPNEYYNLIQIILNHPNIIAKRHLNISEIQTKISFFITELDNLSNLIINTNSGIALNVVSDFIRTFLEFKQYNNFTEQVLVALQKNFFLLQQEYEVPKPPKGVGFT